MATGPKFFANMSSAFENDRRLSLSLARSFVGSGSLVGAKPTKTVTDTFSLISSTPDWGSARLNEIAAEITRRMLEEIETELRAALLGYTHHGVIETPSRRFAVGE